MQAITRGHSVKTIFSFLIGIIGISFIVLIHEMGHFLCAKIFHVSTPIFSIGFGPTIISFPVGTTLFKIAMIPLGGYVEINNEQLEQLNYFAHSAIMAAGIIFNLIFSYCIFYWYRQAHQKETLKNYFREIAPQSDQKNNFIGPLGVIAIIGKSFSLNKSFFLFVLAIISFNMALFNILPLPFLDGGKIFLLTIEKIIGSSLSPTIMGIISSFFLLLFACFVAKITCNDVKQLFKK